MRLALLCVLALAATASAQPAAKQPTQAQLTAAKTHFQAAEAAKAKGDFKTAAVEYLAAYEQFNDPEFFFNVAEVYRLANDEPNALMYYQKYLELDANGRGAVQARSNVDALRRSIAAREDAAKHDAEMKAKADEEAKRKADEGAKRQGQPEPLETVDTPETEPTAPAAPGRTLRIAGIATAGVGVVAISVGIVFGLKASSISSEAADWDMFDQARFDEGQAAERNMFILTGVGAAALVGGGVMYYLGHRAAADASSVAVVPSLSPNHVGVVAAGHF